MYSGKHSVYPTNIFFSIKPNPTYAERAKNMEFIPKRVISCPENIAHRTYTTFRFQLNERSFHF